MTKETCVWTQNAQGYPISECGDLFVAVSPFCPACGGEVIAEFDPYHKD